MADFRFFTPSVLLFALVIVFILAVGFDVVSELAPCTLHYFSDWSFCPGCGLALNSYCPVCFESYSGSPRTFCADCGTLLIVP